VELTTRDKIIFALVNKNGQRFTELHEDPNTKKQKINRDSLARGLNNLEKEKIIEKIDGLYYFSTEIKNPLLLSLNGCYTVAKKLDGFIEDMKKIEDPFPRCKAMITSIILLQIKLKIERYSTPKLTAREKLEFDLFSDIFDAVIESIFDLLRKKPRKLLILKEELMKMLPSKTDSLEN